MLSRMFKYFLVFQPQEKRKLLWTALAHRPGPRQCSVKWMFLADGTNERDFQSLFACISFFYSAYVDLYWHVYITTAFTSAGCIAFYVADGRILSAVRKIALTL